MNDFRSYAASLPPSAGALIRALQLAEVARAMREYDSVDNNAVRLQAWSYRAARLEALAKMIEGFAKPLAIFIGVFFLLPLSGLLTYSEFLSAINNPVISQSAFIIEFVAIITIVLVRVLLTHYRPFESWLQARAEAAAKRFAIFSALMRSKVPTQADEMPLLPLQLEFYVQCYFEWDRAYFARRGRDHSRIAKRLHPSMVVFCIVFVAALVWFLMWLAAFAGQISLPNLWIERSFFAFSAVVAFAVGTKASLSEMQFYDRNAFIYKSIHKNLEILSQVVLPEAREAAARGDRDGVVQFIRLSQMQILSEYQGVLRPQDLLI